MKQIYLSKRNLLTLLSKLERLEKGETTACTLIKYRHNKGQFLQSDDAILVTAVPDDIYYSDQQRGAGDVHPLDDPEQNFIEP